MTEADSGKFRALLEQLREIGVGPKSDTRVVVFSERVQTLEWLARTVPQALGFKGKAAQEAARVMHGGLSDEQQMQCVEDFGLADTPVRILFTGDVASEGVNLHRQCHQLIHYDVSWSLRACRETSRGFQLRGSLIWYGETGGDRGRLGCEVPGAVAASG
ncbi:C-terminal helicase domain-containing protein [Streptomyces sp. NPDC007070]|uniref:C-terminal helicase domain-containing protein n=1 Tax=Streptomyces sp. NPDC007070 TaxID=3154312 RepID=UPI003411387D